MTTSTTRAPTPKVFTSGRAFAARRAETRTRRLETLIDCSRKGERIPPLAYPSHAK